MRHKAGETASEVGQDPSYRAGALGADAGVEFPTPWVHAATGQGESWVCSWEAGPLSVGVQLIPLLQVRGRTGHCTACDLPTSHRCLVLDSKCPSERDTFSNPSQKTCQGQILALETRELGFQRLGTNKKCCSSWGNVSYISNVFR